MDPLSPTYYDDNKLGYSKIGPEKIPGCSEWLKEWYKNQASVQTGSKSFEMDVLKTIFEGTYYRYTTF